MAGTVGAVGSAVSAGVKLSNDTLNFKVGGKRPNIIFIMLDDSGIGDFTCYNSNTPVKSPNITKLGSRGMRFTNAYAAAHLCGPSRCGLMTGKHLGHASMRGNFNTASIQARDVTIPEVLKTAGYATGGYGKWGIAAPGTIGTPERKGFDDFFGFYHQAHAHTHYPDRLYHNGQAYIVEENVGTSQRKTGLVPDKYAYQQKLIFDHMKQFVKTHAQSGQPFFAYGPWTLPHSDDTIPQVESEPGGSYEPYSSKSWAESAKVQAAMISMVDRQIGELIKLLEDPNEDGNTDDSIADNTVIIFCSDNGGGDNPVAGAWERNFGLRGSKGTFYEGGLRTPFICVWPGKIKPGTVSNLLTYSPDMMATFADLAGVPGAVPADTDGISIMPTLLGRRTQQRESIYFQDHNIQPLGKKKEAARMGDWKIHRSTSGVIELYDLSADPAETSNVASSNSSIVAQMKAYMDSQHTKMRPQFNIDPPQVGNIHKDGIIEYGVRPQLADRNWNIDESGDAKLLTGNLKDTSGSTVGLHMDDLDHPYKVEMSVTVNGSAHPELQFELMGSSGFVYFSGTLATSSVPGGSTATLDRVLELTDITPDKSDLSGDRNQAITLKVSHNGNSGDVSIDDIAIKTI